jgi:hypothetical protein
VQHALGLGDHLDHLSGNYSQAVMGVGM